MTELAPKVCWNTQSVEQRPLQDDPEYIDGVKQRAEELEGVLRDFAERLRDMRERNRATQRTIERFQADLDELHDWLAERL